MHYLHATFCTWILAQTWMKKRGKGQEFRKVLLIYSCMHMTYVKCVKSTYMLLPPSGCAAHVNVFCLHFWLVSRSQTELWSYGKYCEECMEGLRRNVFTLGEKKVSYKSFSSELKEHKQNMCLPFWQCNCTIALLEEQDVLQDSFSLSFAHKRTVKLLQNHSPLRNNHCFPSIKHYRQYSSVLFSSHVVRNYFLFFCETQKETLELKT